MTVSCSTVAVKWQQYKNDIGTVVAVKLWQYNGSSEIVKRLW